MSISPTVAETPTGSEMPTDTLQERLRSMKSALSMTKQRCYNPRNSDYSYYGGRGITVCDRWLAPEVGFSNFVQDMGVRPDGMTLERLNNDGPYSPENCVWATRQEQSSNTRRTRTLTFKGKTQSWLEWSRELGIPYGTIKARVTVLGYTAEETLTKEVKCGGKLPSKTYKPVVRRKMAELTPRGFASKLTALNREQVLEIRAALAKPWPNTPTKVALARQYNVNVCTITAVQLREGAYRDS